MYMFKKEYEMLKATGIETPEITASSEFKATHFDRTHGSNSPYGYTSSFRHQLPLTSPVVAFVPLIQIARDLGLGLCFPVSEATAAFVVFSLLV